MNMGVIMENVYVRSSQRRRTMKKFLCLALALIMAVSMFMATGCMNKNDGYTKTEIDGFVENLKLQINSKTEFSSFGNKRTENRLRGKDFNSKKGR